MDLNQTIIIGLAVFISSVFSAVAGFGSAFIVIAALSFYFDIKTTLAFFVVLSIFANVSKTTVYRKTIDVTFIKYLVIGLVPGLLLGLSFFKVMPERPMELLMGLLGLYLIADHFIPLPKIKRFTNKGMLIWGFIWGVVAGTANGGSIKVMLLKWRKLDKYHFVGSGAVLSLFIDSFKTVAYFLMGFLKFSQITVLLPAILLNILGTYIGKRILDQTSQAFFETAMLIMIFIGSIRFLFF